MLSIGAYTVIGENTVVGNNTKIGSGCAVGIQVRIGEDCLLYPNVVIYHQCILENRVVLHSGAVVGSDGLFLHQSRMVHTKRFPSWATLSLRTMWRLELTRPVDRACAGDTHIHRGVKIDNLVSNCTQCYCREHTVIASQTGISGSTKIGKHCMIGGQVWFCRSYWNSQTTRLLCSVRNP